MTLMTYEYIELKNSNTPIKIHRRMVGKFTEYN